jgi:hypothetical protein
VGKGALRRGGRAEEGVEKEGQDIVHEYVENE